MSTVHRSSAAYLGNLAALRAAQPEHDAWFRALTEGVTSTALADLHRRLGREFRHDSIDDLRRALTVVAEIIPEDVVPLPPAPTLETSEADPAALLPILVTAVDGARHEVAAYEQRATAEAVGLALDDLGYIVERAQLEGVVTGFEASTTDAKLLVEVTAGGAVVSDFVGLADGASCSSAQADLVGRVSHYGVLLTERDRDDHCDARGGGLARRAARAEGHTLAERIVAAHQARASQPAGRVRRTRRVIA